MKSTITSVEVELNESSLVDFLSETSDVDVACEEYRAEYERRLRAQYPSAECHVRLGQTDGMYDWYYINGERVTNGSDEYWDELLIIETIADRVGNDWTWLTV